MDEVAIIELPSALIAIMGDAEQATVGIVGPPGVGKSTIAKWLADQTNGVVVPLDGFHLDHRVLEQQGWVDRKGAPFTFDSWGFSRSLHRIQDREPGEIVYFPRFDRTLENAVAGAIGVSDQSLVLVEGNYLLLEQQPWVEARKAIDLIVYLDLSVRTRLLRLMRRHVAHGRSRREAADFVRSSDCVNAAAIESVRAHADLAVCIDGFAVQGEFPHDRIA